MTDQPESFDLVRVQDFVFCAEDDVGKELVGAVDRSVRGEVNDPRLLQRRWQRRNGLGV